MREEPVLNFKEKEIQIYLKYDGFEEDFHGPVDDVLRAVMVFLDKVLPGLQVLSQVKLSIDLHKIIEQMKNVIAIAPDGPMILCKEKLDLKELIGLNLIGVFVGYKLNLIDKVTLSLNELVTLTNKTKGSISGTLTNMANNRLVEKLGRGNYKISVIGLKHFSDEVLPKLKNRSG